MEAIVTIKATLKDVALLRAALANYRDSQAASAKVGGATPSTMKYKKAAQEQSAYAQLLLEKLGS